MKRGPYRAALLASAATLLLVLLALNFSTGEKRIERDLKRLYSVADPQFRRSMSVLLGPTILEGNRVEVLLNGDQIFPAMLAAIKEAKRTITFETYIYWSGTIGEEFVEALSERARAGVKVHVLLDWLGSVKMESRYLDSMRAAGIEVERYHKPDWWQWARLNNRTHRKLLVVDGSIGFTGGVGIADEWRGNAQDPKHWRDTHFRIDGPVVAQVQSTFIDNWIKATGRVLHGQAYFPALKAKGDLAAQMFSSSPSGGSESMRLMYLMAITSAGRGIRLSTPYFVPDDLASNALIAAAARGVKVQIIVPGEHIDTEVVRQASRAGWGPLLEAGIEIFEYQPTMYHTKLLVVDELFTSVGSTNFDNRSLSLNDEANLNVIDAGFGAEQGRIFDDDLKRARRITLADWRNRPMIDKLTERFVSMLSFAL
ncbi:MAG: cardiolipin synthase [Burkholderiales bacterium]